MSGLQYARIPQCANQIKADGIRVKAKVVTSIPNFSASEATSPTVAAPQPTSPTKQPFNLQHFLLSSSLHLPNPPPTPPSDGALLSTREPLSLQVTAVNFRRFVSKSGPVFWLQDRIEEVLMWKRGWKVTCIWMAIYTFLCTCCCRANPIACSNALFPGYFPRMVLLLPHVILISILLVTHGDHHPSVRPEQTVPVFTPQPKEGTVDWYANLQAIQNLMGAM